MELLNAVVMVIAAFILFGALDTAGNYSALLRSVDLYVGKAQSVLDMPTMDIDGWDIVPTNYDIDVENVEFSYDKKKIIDGISVHIPEKTTTAIEALTKEKAILMIAHRLKTVRHADYILVIDSGKTTQSGIHQQLMQQGGLYRLFVESRELAVGWKV